MVGAEQAESIFLNDLRWSPQVTYWNDILLLLEGQLVHLPAVNSHFVKDMAFKKDTSIFCTRKYPIVLIRNGMMNERETEIMTVRWRVFNYNYQLPVEQQRHTSMPKMLHNSYSWIIQKMLSVWNSSRAFIVSKFSFQKQCWHSSFSLVW